jgi:hypothetical protein
MMRRSAILLKKNVVCADGYPNVSSHLLTFCYAGAKLIYLPPYSPDFNPIEQAFHSIKAWLCQHEVEATLPEVHLWLIQWTAMSVMQKDGYSIMGTHMNS